MRWDRESACVDFFLLFCLLSEADDPWNQVNWLRAMCNVYRDMLLPVAEVVSAKEIILDEVG